MKKLTKKDLFALDWFKQFPMRKFSNEEIRNLLPAEYQKSALSKRDKFQDPSRSARKLAENKRIQKFPANKARFYWYDPESDYLPEEFDDAEKAFILERDGLRCVVCGRGVADGVKVSVGYALSTRRGGKLNVDNGRTLCPTHRWTLETAQDSDEGQRNWRKLLSSLPKVGEPRAQKFWEEFLELLKRYGIEPPK